MLFAVSICCLPPPDAVLLYPCCLLSLHAVQFAVSLLFTASIGWWPSLPAMCCLLPATCCLHLPLASACLPFSVCWGAVHWMFICQVLPIYLPLVFCLFAVRVRLFAVYHLFITICCLICCLITVNATCHQLHHPASYTGGGLPFSALLSIITMPVSYTN